MSDRCCDSRDACCEDPERRKIAPARHRQEPDDSCCEAGVPVFDGLDPRYKRILWIVIAINAVMFLTRPLANLRGRKP
jgi:hypothetical protein